MIENIKLHKIKHSQKEETITDVIDDFFDYFVILYNYLYQFIFQVKTEDRPNETLSYHVSHDCFNNYPPLVSMVRKKIAIEIMDNNGNKELIQNYTKSKYYDEKNRLKCLNNDYEPYRNVSFIIEKSPNHHYKLSKSLTLFFKSKEVDNYVIEQIGNHNRKVRQVYRYKATLGDYYHAVLNELETGYNEIMSLFQPEIKKTEPKQNTSIKEQLTTLEINLERLKPYFNSQFKGMGNNLNHFDTLAEELKTNRIAKEFAQIALLIYESGKMSNRKPTTFKKWYNIFCECIGCEKKTYKPNQLKPFPESLTKLFNYLT